jgi:hypothetical protein
VESWRQSTLDDRIGGLALCQLQLIGRFVGDRGRDDRTADVDENVGRRLAFLHIRNFPFENIARAELHWDLHFDFKRRGIKHTRPFAASLSSRQSFPPVATASVTPHSCFVVARRRTQW